ncbi:uncharacterized protein LOC120734576 isoform X4 [Simochromis diagramma]|uniref:uncharacterized protein LOC120734576 isoform X4 n=1 Tax=Simochromis diagramma TaxID=43689 RepID=UPI001A7E7DC3|nr:uncharacterized protein LOC120734576 isoform X4 [Simochromis diagramma]
MAFANLFSRLSAVDEGVKSAGQPAVTQRNEPGGGGRKRKTQCELFGSHKKDFQVKPRFMTQEFKDQNALLVDGRLLCRHFLYGRCLKAESCQLEHIQGYNDLIKEVCKFYIQGFCTKGESCPYMHKSFPCKFFHRKGKCYQGEDCKFSHEPLTDVTGKLLDELLKWQRDLSELAKKAEQEPLGQPASEEEAGMTETNGTPSVFMDPLRPNFYRSADAATEGEPSVHQIQEMATVTDEAVLRCAADTARPHSPSSTSSNCPEPVCYSVEAMLGPQLYRSFPSFYNTPESKESTTPSAAETTSEATLGSTTQKEVPYSVDAVLRSLKSVENYTLGQRLTASSVKTEEIQDPLLSSQHQVQKVSLSIKHEPNKPFKKMYKSLSSLQVHDSLISSSDLILSSGTQQCGAIPESLKSAEMAFHEVKLEHLLHPVIDEDNPASSKSKSDMNESSQLPTDNTRPPKHLSGISTSSGVSEFKSRTSAPVEPADGSIKTSDSANVAVHHFAAKQLAEIPRYPRKTKSVGAQKRCSAKMSPECSGKTPTLSDCSAGRKKTQKIPFSCLFKNPIAESVTPTPDPARASQPAHFTSKEGHLKTEVKPEKTSAASFLSLFANPLSETLSLPPCSQASAESPFQSVSNVELAPSCEVQTDVKQSPDSCSTTSEAEPDPVKQPADPACSIVQDSIKETSSSPAPGGPNPSETLAQQQLPHVSSPTRAPKGSVLKSLFVSLSPYQEDAEQRGGIQISELEMNNKGRVGHTFGKQQHEEKKHRTSSSRPTVKASARSTDDQLSFQTPQNSSEVTAGPTLSSPGVTEPQVRNSGTYKLPLEPATPEINHHTDPREMHCSRKEKRGRGRVGVTPLKDLFKTLGSAVFHLGR